MQGHGHRRWIPVGLLIIASLILGTAGVAYSQAGQVDQAPTPELGSETAPTTSPTTSSTVPVTAEVLDDLTAELPEEELPVTAEVLADLTEDLTEDLTGPAASRPGVVHLTFDDGPHPVYTPVILDVLARHGAKATFFVLGSQVEAHPELYQRILAEGHTVANHTWRHRDLTTLTQAEFNDTILRTQEILGEHANGCLRPPFGAFNADTRAWAEELGLELVLWTTDTRDWRKPGADAIAASIIAGAESGGSPILLHDGGGKREQTIEGLDLALTQLSGHGLSYEPLC